MPPLFERIKNMARVPFNPKIGTIRTDAGNFATDRAFLARYLVEDVAAASTVNILPFTKLAVGAQASVLPADGIPDCPRNVQIDGNNSGQNNVVKVYGTDFGGNAISEEITLNATTAKAGLLAFASVTKIDLPAWDNAGAKHKSTVAVSAATVAGTAVLTFVSAATGEAYDISAVLAAGDVVSTTTAAARLKAVLNADEKFSAAYLADSSTANLTIERKINENSDSAINLTVKDAGDTGLVLGAINKTTTTGVCDEVSVGWGASLGIPYKLSADEKVIVKLFDNSADSGIVTADAADLSKNVIALNGTPNGAKDVELIIVV